jgi:16S rRNA (guanine966-N2)-methyltransferase
VRIIAGTHRGRRLETPKGARTRPTSDRAREALYSIVGPVDGARVLDVFAGSGAMGLEALSRGAARAVFVENDRDACRAIERNLAALGLEGTIVRRDALRALREEVARGRRYDLVLVDAPYDDWDALAAPLADVLPPLLAENGLLVVETAAKVEPELPLDPVTSRRYGSARITVFSR